MKSLLPFLGLAAANAGPCSQTTIYETATNTHTVTVQSGSSDAAPVSSFSTDGIVTLTSVIYITPTPIPQPAYPLPNGTFNASHPTSLASSTLRFFLASSSDASPSSSTPIATSPSPSPSQPTSPNLSNKAALSSTNTGEATFYGGNVAGGMCSFTDYTIPSNLYGTALSDSNWAGAQNCGVCVSVKGPNGNSITAMVVDQCPGCGPNHLDLFPPAFSALASPSKGVIPVSWTIVPCGITSPLVLKNKSGTSRYWFSMQVMNSNVAVAKLEVSTDGGKSWKGTTRQPYNFFENSGGFGTESVDVRVTGVGGGVVVVRGVSVASGAMKTAGGNLS
ncbi:barwin-like endoglucanase [Polyplosphaeria fusca]|uniref:Barwin-like endoglucanase n=1 Tax=Polyplosphaeria fusca TaxID=682080 RepID=A0A9P4V0H2_9PLEO|nr:barwin-like endoglucanase [Polyplosphaeria fusca]